jgi:hypothetical protein
MFAYYDGTTDQPQATSGMQLSNGQWSYSQDQMASYYNGENYSCPTSPSSTLNLASSGGTITGHIFNCSGIAIGGALITGTGGTCHAGSCDGLNLGGADGFQMGPEAWSFWTTGKFF